MKNRGLIHLGMLFILLSVFASIGICDISQSAPFIRVEEPGIIANYINEVRTENYSSILAKNNKPQSLDMSGNNKADGGFKRKSPLKAFAYSLVVPGAGQLYTGSKTKALLFLGLEALTWTGHVVYHGKGDDNTVIYESFAKENWKEQRYRDWLEENWGVPTDDDIALFTHHLPGTQTQQYYEMIGKYDQFVYGWNDTDSTAEYSSQNPHPSADSPNRHIYEGLRNDANRMYDRASTAMVVMMLNHVISGFEAALSARSYNKNSRALAQRISFKAYAAKDLEDYYPMISMTYKF